LRRIHWLFVRCSSLLFLLVGGWAGCRCRPTSPAAEPAATPSLRLVLLSTVAGAVEPCGCVKDMLGGVDHASAYLNANNATPRLALGAGPMLFMDPLRDADRHTQDTWKAEALASSLVRMGVRAWAPGVNDFVAGAAELKRMTTKGPLVLGANLRADGVELGKSGVYSVGNVEIGVAGVSLPKHFGKAPAGVEVADPERALRLAARELTRRGVNLRVALLAMQRGEALRLLEKVQDFQIALIGKAVDQGEANDPVTPPSRIGRTLVIESQNHLQSFYVVDLFLKEGSFELQNAQASGEERASIDARIADLEQRIAAGERSQGVRKDDLDARRVDLAGLRKQRRSIKDDATPAGSSYLVRRVEVREALGKDAVIEAQLGEYYRKVNQHNREVFADRVPPPVPKDGSGYVGREQCALCHAEEQAFWSTTRHAQAYETLSKQHKQFNLDCVGCHVTGYEEPGGTTVTHVEKLKDVQCEVCHGPGSRHASDPANPSLIIRDPDPKACASKCHHPPHVKPDWSVESALRAIVGPGHGLPSAAQAAPSASK
jgi:2',3'-cyclic-nucleotide 2'-phosphodiesterase (5'-nucleotidase family)